MNSTAARQEHSLNNTASNQQAVSSQRRPGSSTNQSSRSDSSKPHAMCDKESANPTSQGLLFSEPAIAETGIWCELNEGIDPARWAYLCRHLGALSPAQFNKTAKKLLPNPDSLFQRLKRMFTPDRRPDTRKPILSLGPSGIQGQYQKEVYASEPCAQHWGC